MAISGKPYSDYIMETLVEELRRISKERGYFTDVADAIEPDFGFGAEDQISRVADAQDGPMLFVWTDSDGESEDGNTRGGAADVCLMRVRVLGVLKQPTKVQSATRRFAADVRRVMRSNQHRCWPQDDNSHLGASNNYVKGTRSGSSPTFEYDYGIDPNTTVGLFQSIWDIEYIFPHATG